MPDKTADTIDPLTRLAIHHGSDKFGTHFYTPIYHELFASWRRRKFRMLEIGVGGFAFETIGGASLRMWADYFPRARIVGIDIVAKRLDVDPRVTILQGSQDDREFLARVVAEHGPFDLIIDDGSHVPAHVYTSFDRLFPTLNDGGLYVIEDVQTCFWESRGGDPKTGSHTMHIAHAVLDALHHAEIQRVDAERQFPPLARYVRSFRAFHNIFVFEKGDNTQPSSHAFYADNPHAIRAMAVMEAQLAQAATAEAYANLITTFACASEFARADAALATALARWPDNHRLLVAAFDYAYMRGDKPEARRLLDLLAEKVTLDSYYDHARQVLEEDSAAIP